MCSLVVNPVNTLPSPCWVIWYHMVWTCLADKHTNAQILCFTQKMRRGKLATVCLSSSCRHSCVIFTVIVHWLSSWNTFCWMLSLQCCRHRRTATRLQGSNDLAADIGSDNEDSDENDLHDDASVHMYVPLDQGSTADTAGDGDRRNTVHEPPHLSSHIAGPSYVQMQRMPPQQSHSCHWHVFTDSSDNSDTDEPLVDFEHVFVPARSTLSANSNKVLVSTCGDRFLCLESTAEFGESGSNRGRQVTNANVQGAGVVYQHWPGGHRLLIFLAQIVSGDHIALIFLNSHLTVVVTVHFLSLFSKFCVNDSFIITLETVLGNSWVLLNL